MAVQPMVSVTGLEKRYGQKTGIAGITFGIGRGECVGLLGPNGAGKSTLLKILCGLMRPTAGNVRILDQDPCSVAEPGRTLGFVFDPAGLPPDLTVRECLTIEALGQDLGRGAVGKATEGFELSEFVGRRVRKLSTGQRQRAALAAAMMGDPEILILDEPMNGLDIESTRWLRKKIEERTVRNKTTLISSHNLAEVRRLADRAIVIRRNQRFDGPIPELGESELERWYLSLVDDGATADSGTAVAAGKAEHA
ncbi:ABC transporter ATP-binding protein [Arthrobacter sp.]|uniref:ABC transporter ATP-binding protein n=1 Tax=Arthrobacter sp. TaxID=1667 RepID=UPI0028117655|nr:ABC transporter ATP-binding protein [Arthrobacter sp.]